MTAKNFYYVLTMLEPGVKWPYNTLPEKCVHVEYAASFTPGKTNESIEKYRDKGICIETNTSFDTGRIREYDEFTKIKCNPEITKDIIFSTEHREFFKRTENNIYKRIREIGEDAPDNGITERITIVPWETIPKFYTTPILDRS